MTRLYESCGIHAALHACAVDQDFHDGTFEERTLCESARPTGRRDRDYPKFILQVGGWRGAILLRSIAARTGEFDHVDVT